MRWYLDKLSTINKAGKYDLASQDWITEPNALPTLTYADTANSFLDLMRFRSHFWTEH